MTRTNRAKLSFALDTSAGLPHEFRVFSAGWNDTTKGRFLFDDAAAQSVMADYAQHGADMMIDLEHLSLESPQESRNFDPDARGWARLELRGGDLWAVDVRWTSDGAERLSQKRQRYISPAFDVDLETKRVLRLVNIAITSLPATHGLTPLVAAADRGAGSMEQLLAALGLDASASMDEVLAAIGDLKAKLDAAMTPDEPESPAEDAAEPGEEMMAQPQDEEQKAMAAQLTRLTGRTALVDAIAEVEVWRKSHVELAAREQKLAQERAALEAGKRKQIGVKLAQKLGPAAVCAKDSDGMPVPGTLAEPWASMPLDAFEAYVAGLGETKIEQLAQPKRAKVGGVELTERELRICRETGVSPEEYAANKAIVTAAKAKKGAA